MGRCFQPWGLILSTQETSKMMLNHRSTRPWKDLAIFGSYLREAYLHSAPPTKCIQGCVATKPGRSLDHNPSPIYAVRAYSQCSQLCPVEACTSLPLISTTAPPTLPATRKSATRRHGTSHATASRAPTLTGVFVKDASIAFFSPDSFETSRGLAATESKREYLKSVAKSEASL